MSVRSKKSVAGEMTDVSINGEEEDNPGIHSRSSSTKRRDSREEDEESFIDLDMENRDPNQLNEHIEVSTSIE